MTQSLIHREAISTVASPCRNFPGAAANRHVRNFVYRAVKVCRPDRIYWCNGSEYERSRLIDEAVRDGILTPVDRDEDAPCYLHRSDSRKQDDRATVFAPATCVNFEVHFKDCMRGRTLYVVPFAAGALGAAPAKVGVEITDSVVTAINTALVSHVGDIALRYLGDVDSFVRRIESHRAGRKLDASVTKF